MEKVAMEGFAFVDGGVCAAKGFRAGGVYCGIKENPEKKNDLMVVAADTPVMRQPSTPRTRSRAHRCW